MIVVHIDERFAASQSSDGPPRVSDPWARCADALGWFGGLAHEDGQSVFALLPKRVEPSVSDALRDYDAVVPIWHGDDGVTSLPPVRTPKRIWLINGRQLPLVDWEAAEAAVRRSKADVTVYGTAGTTGADRYHESVEVAATGEVLRFKRHYGDSPVFADPWSGEAAFLAVSAENAPAVINHVLARGWGLESVGALTRRFSVRWAPDACVLAELDPSMLWGATPAHRIGGGNGRTRGARGGAAPVSRNLSSRSVPGRAYPIVKRAVDIVAACAGLIVLSPLLLVVAVLVKYSSRGPLLFGHKRQGLGGKEFSCWKFRTMQDGAHALQVKLRAQNEVDGPQFKIMNDPRLTRFGAWLRRTNIDELPQLINVLLGQMSLVGPRPSPDGENQLCPAWRRTRLSVKPGMTGLWQVLRLRDEEEQSDFQEWIYYDVEYARHQSLWFDLQILLYTPISMVAPNRATRLARRLQRRGICTHSARLRTTSSH